MSNILKIAAISGSLRKASYNTALIRAAKKLAPSSMQIEEILLHDIPMYNSDVQDQGFPAPVLELDKKLRHADGILLVSPEYNYSIPGVLKNAIDWLSRIQNQAFDSKVVAIMSASMSPLGGVRMHYNLRQTLIYLNPDFLNRPEIMVGSAHEKFSASGELLDETTRKYVASALEALQAKILKSK
jgi:chromate reductase